jgi:uncharacterized membrane protein SpoIIM required for sporulation
MSRKRRFAFLAIAAAVFAGVYSAGAVTIMSDEEAQTLKQEFESQVQGVEGIGIFLNNIRIALMMFIPGFGVFIGMFSAYSTGLVFKALAQTTPQIADLPPLIILATPFGIMEVFSYGMAMSQSGILINEILRKRSLKPWLVPTMIQLGIVVGILLAAAFIEFYMIEQFTPEITKIET